jgi:multidrug efflux system membrane fusion protein
MIVPRALKFLHTRWLLCAVLTLFTASAWSFLGMGGGGRHARGGGDAQVIPVATALAASGDMKLFIDGLGTVTPANSVLVRSQVGGQLMRVHFREGQMVHVGDLLAEIDPRPYQVQLLQAQGQLARDEALLQNAHLDLERYRTLWSQDSIAKQQVDAQAALVRQYEGTVAADRGQIADAKLQLTYARVTAPISGRVGLRMVDPGNIISAGDTTGIVSITQIQPITVVFALPEDNLPRIVQKLRDKSVVPVDAYDRQQKIKLASGTLLTVDNQIDTTTGTVKLKAQFDNADGALFPNQFVNVRMLIDTLRGRTLIPVAAVQRGAQGNFVYVVQKDQTVALQPIQLGDTEADRVVVEEGLAPGAEVVVEGLDKVHAGSKVEAVARAGAAVAAETGPVKPAAPAPAHAKPRQP